jgi:hypothetical protein
LLFCHVFALLLVFLERPWPYSFDELTGGGFKASVSAGLQPGLGWPKGQHYQVSKPSLCQRVDPIDGGDLFIHATDSNPIPRRQSART